MLLHNTAALVARLEAEHAEGLARRNADKDASAVNERRAPFEEDRKQQQRWAAERRPLRPDDGSDWRQPVNGKDALSQFRWQQALVAARVAMQRRPELARYTVSQVAEVMMQAKAQCIARGLRMDDSEARSTIEREAVALLTGGLRR